jgi:hypothetical protein
MVSNREYYFDAKNKVAYDGAVRELVKLAGYKEQPKEVAYNTLRQQLTDAIQTSVNGERDMSACKTLAKRIGSLGKEITDTSTLAAWQGELQKIITGKESFTPKSAKSKAKPVTDPCVAAIAALGKTA